MSAILIKNIRAVDAKTDKVTDVLIDDGVIAEVGENLRTGAEQFIDGTDLVLMPSLFDIYLQRGRSHGLCSSSCGRSYRCSCNAEHESALR